jgi:hypothetical protein
MRRILVFAALLALGCTTPAVAQIVVQVTDLEGLYAAVNDPGNVGAIIDVAPGTYALTPLDPLGFARPNSGRLIPPVGSILRGHNTYARACGDGDGEGDDRPPGELADPATETVIDAGLLTSLIGPQDVITVGFANTVEFLTVQNNLNAGALIGIKVPPEKPLPAGMVGLDGTVRGCILQGGMRGIRPQHMTANSTGLISRAVIEGNIARNQTGQFGIGIEVQNAGAAAKNTTWDVTMRNNRCYENNFGAFIVTLTGSGNGVSIVSIGNVFSDNGVGLALEAGRDGGQNDQMRYLSINDTIVNNSRPVTTTLGGGIDARAGFHTAGVIPGNNDLLRLQLIGTRIGGNFNGGSARDITVYGSSGVGGLSPGSNNLAEVIAQRLEGNDDLAVLIVDSQPADPTNHVRVIGLEGAREAEGADVDGGPEDDPVLGDDE